MGKVSKRVTREDVDVLSLPLSSPNDIAKKHRLSLVLVGLFSLETNRSLVLMPNGSLSLVTVGREDRRGPTTTDVFFAISFRLVSLSLIKHSVTLRYEKIIKFSRHLDIR